MSDLVLGLDIGIGSVGVGILKISFNVFVLSRFK